MLAGLVWTAVLEAWGGPEVGMLHAARVCVHGPGAELFMLPPQNSDPPSPIPEHTSQAYFASVSSRAPLNS